MDAQPRVKIEEVHRHMWSLVDDRHRLQIKIATLAETFEVRRKIVNEALLAMRDTGRIRYVACRPGKLYVYEVSNPDTFRATRGLRGRKPNQPAWG